MKCLQTTWTRSVLFGDGRKQSNRRRYRKLALQTTADKTHPRMLGRQRRIPQPTSSAAQGAQSDCTAFHSHPAPRHCAPGPAIPASSGAMRVPIACEPTTPIRNRPLHRWAVCAHWVSARAALALPRAVEPGPVRRISRQQKPRPSTDSQPVWRSANNPRSVIPGGSPPHNLGPPPLAPLSVQERHRRRPHVRYHAGKQHRLADWKGACVLVESEMTSAPAQPPSPFFI